MQCPRCGKTHATIADAIVCFYPDTEVLLPPAEHTKWVEACNTFIDSLGFPCDVKVYWDDSLSAQDLYDLNIGVGVSELERWFNL